MEDEYISLKTFKRKNTKTATKFRSFGNLLKSGGKKAGSLIGSGSKKAYKGVTSEKAVKGYKSVGKTVKKGLDSYYGKPKKVAKKKKASNKRGNGSVTINIVTNKTREPKAKKKEKKKGYFDFIGF